MSSGATTIPGYHRRLVIIRSRLASTPPQLIYACINANRADLPPLPDGLEHRHPTIEHTLVPCYWCGEDCWFGRRQQELLGSIDEGYKMCLACIATMKASGILPAGTQSVMLSTGIDPAPRRT